jgi:triacylglycerol esterase/lipase EstA (alpha/beta hydrolase family)
MINMISNKMPSHTQCVWSLTMTFMPATDDSDVMGSVSAAITASRSAAMVILVSVRARQNSVTPIKYRSCESLIWATVSYWSSTSFISSSPSGGAKMVSLIARR